MWYIDKCEGGVLIFCLFGDMNNLCVALLSAAALVALDVVLRAENQYISSRLLPRVFDSTIDSLLKKKGCEHWELLSYEYSDANHSHYYLTTIGDDKVEIVIYLSMMGWEIHTMTNDGK